MNADNFLDLLSNPQVEDKLQLIFKGLFITTAKEVTKPLENKLNELTVTIKNLQRDILSRDNQIGIISAENSKLKDEIKIIKHELELSDQANKRDNLIITGIDASIGEVASSAVGPRSGAESHGTTIAKVVSFCNDVLGVSISAEDLSVAHRLKSRHSPSKPPIFVRFLRRTIRDEVYGARLKLKESNASKVVADRVYINEDLVGCYQKLLKKAKEHYKSKLIKGCWSSNCRVKIKCLDDSIHSVANFADLASIISAHSRSSFDDCAFDDCN